MSKSKYGRPNGKMTLESYRARRNNELTKDVLDACKYKGGLEQLAQGKRDSLYKHFRIQPFLGRERSVVYGCEPDLELLKKLERKGIYHPGKDSEYEQIMVAIGHGIVKPNDIFIKEESDRADCKKKFKTVHNFMVADMGMKLCDGHRSFAYASGRELDLVYLLSTEELRLKGKLHK